MVRQLKYLTFALLSSAAFATAASAQSARITTDLAMRAGPSNDFPIVTTVYDGSVVHVHGCVRGYSWCDVSWHGDRGWVYADYLTYRYHDRYVPIIEYGDEIDLPIIVFSVDSYWDDYYRGRPWFHNREHWRSVWRGEEHHFGERGEHRRGRVHEHEGRNVEHGNRGNHEANRVEHRGPGKEDHNRGEHRAERSNDFPTGSIRHGGGDHGGRGDHGGMERHGGGDHGGRGGRGGAMEHGGGGDHGGGDGGDRNRH